MDRLRREFGVKIGSSTGYTSEIMEKLKVENNGKGKGKELDYHTCFITFHITFLI